MQHGPCDQVGKVGDKQAVVNKVEFFRLATGSIYQKGNLREGEKRNAQGQDDVRQSVAGAQRRVDGIDKEVGVFEVAQ